jgi:HK97 family phage major capsid protein
MADEKQAQEEKVEQTADEQAEPESKPEPTTVTVDRRELNRSIADAVADLLKAERAEIEKAAADRAREETLAEIRRTDRPDRKDVFDDGERRVPAGPKTHADLMVERYGAREARKMYSFARGLFNKEDWIRYVAGFAMDRDERAAIVGTASDSSGGEHLLPEGFQAEIVVARGAIVRLAKRVKTVNVKTRTGKIPKMTRPSVSWGSQEGTAFTESTPTISRETWSLFRVNAFSKISRDVIEDEGVDIVDRLTQEFGRVLAEERDKVIAVGTNSNQPYGIYYNVANGDMTTYAMGGAITFRGLLGLYFTLPEQYRKDAVWAGSDTNAERIRGLVDNNNQPIWKYGAFGSASGEVADNMVLGKPYITQDDIPNNYLIFGSLASYYLWDRNAVTVEMSTDATDESGASAFLRNETWLKVCERYDGVAVDTAYFTGGTGITG